MNTYSYIKGEFIMNDNYKINDEKKVEKIRNNLLDDDFLVDVAELFKVFGDSSRIKIISALIQDELCVGDIAIITKSSPSAVSHQMQILKQAKLVKTRREGKVIYYSLKDDHVKKIFRIGCEHIEEL